MRNKKVLSKCMILCWATFIAVLGHTWPLGHRLGTRPLQYHPDFPLSNFSNQRIFRYANHISLHILKSVTESNKVACILQAFHKCSRINEKAFCTSVHYSKPFNGSHCLIPPKSNFQCLAFKSLYNLLSLPSKLKCHYSIPRILCQQLISRTPKVCFCFHICSSSHIKCSAQSSLPIQIWLILQDPTQILLLPLIFPTYDMDVL